LGSLNSNQGLLHPTVTDGGPVSVHRISLLGAVLIVLLAIVFLFLIGPLGLLILIVAAILLWYAFGHGGDRVVVT
jgi:hypothetical protein